MQTFFLRLVLRSQSMSSQCVNKRIYVLTVLPIQHHGASSDDSAYGMVPCHAMYIVGEGSPVVAMVLLYHLYCYCMYLYVNSYKGLCILLYVVWLYQVLYSQFPAADMYHFFESPLGLHLYFFGYPHFTPLPTPPT